MGGWSVYRLQKQGGRQGEQKMQQDWLHTVGSSQVVLLRYPPPQHVCLMASPPRALISVIVTLPQENPLGVSDTSPGPH